MNSIEHPDSLKAFFALSEEEQKLWLTIDKATERLEQIKKEKKK